MLIDKFVKYIQTIDNSLNPKIILDVGSRDLEQSIEFNTIFKNARIYAFEPNPIQYKICLDKSKSYENIKVYSSACFDVEEELDFYVTYDNIGASSLLEPLDVPFACDKGFNKIKVKTIKLSKWLNENNINEIDILWMDVQGAELKVFQGMDEYLSRVKFIHCEAAEKSYYKNHTLKMELENFLNENQFETIFKLDCYHPYNEGDIFAVNKKYYK